MRKTNESNKSVTPLLIKFAPWLVLQIRLFKKDKGKSNMETLLCIVLIVQLSQKV